MRRTCLDTVTPMYSILVKIILMVSRCKCGYDLSTYTLIRIVMNANGIVRGECRIFRESCIAILLQLIQLSIICVANLRLNS